MKEDDPGNPGCKGSPATLNLSKGSKAKVSELGSDRSEAIEVLDSLKKRNKDRINPRFYSRRGFISQVLI